MPSNSKKRGNKDRYPDNHKLSMDFRNKDDFDNFVDSELESPGVNKNEIKNRKDTKKIAKVDQTKLYSGIESI